MKVFTNYIEEVELYEETDTKIANVKGDCILTYNELSIDMNDCKIISNKFNNNYTIIHGDQEIKMKGDIHFTFNKNEEGIIHINAKNVFDNTVYPYYSYEIVSRQDTQICNITLHLDRYDSLLVYIISDNVFSKLDYVRTMLHTVKEEFFKPYFEFEGNVYININGKISRIDAVSVGGLLVSTIDIYTQEETSEYIEYNTLFRTRYLLFDDTNIFIIDNKIFKDGYTIGDIKTLNPLLQGGYDFNKSLMIKFANLLEIASNSDEPSVQNMVLNSLTKLKQQINEECEEIIDDFGLDMNTLVIVNKGDAYMFNNKECDLILEELKEIVHSHKIKSEEEIEVLFDQE